MRQATVDVYTFAELPEDAKIKAYSRYYGINVDHNWWIPTHEDAERVGVKIKEFDCDRGSIILVCELPSAAQAILDEHGHDCETYRLAQNYLTSRDALIDAAPRDEDGEFENQLELDDQLDDLDKEFTRQLGQEYLSILRKEYDYLTSEESVYETLIANEYEFTLDGKIYR